MLYVLANVNQHVRILAALFMPLEGH